MTPELIPLGKKNAALVKELTGFSRSQLRALNDGEMPGIVRQRGAGKGARFFLHVPTFRNYAARMKAA